MVENSVLHKEISKLLAGADLNAVTSKKVRLDLERILGCDLRDRKADIEEGIRAALLNTKGAEEQGKGRSADEGLSTDSSLSDLEDGSLPTEKKQNQKKQGKLQRQQQLSDEELARQIHLMENGAPTRQRRSAGRQLQQSKAPRKSGGGGGGGFSKPCTLSPALAKVVGSDSMPRQQVVKRLWDLAKERNLFDPKNKQFVICDAEFEQLFGKKRLKMFALMKYLKNHVKNIDS